MEKISNVQLAALLGATKAYSNENVYISPADTAPLPIPQAAQDRGKTVHVPILMYHHVGTVPDPGGKDYTRSDLTVSTADFEKEVRWLSDNKYASITLAQLLLYSQGRFTMPKKPIIFTFDDGYQDVFDNAIPILKKYNYTGSFGIITQWPGQTQGTNVYASWDTIKSAWDSGMEIVSHTQNHFDGSNSKFTSSYILQNLQGSQKDLHDHGIFSQVLIYPYGHYTSTYISDAKRAGFAMGITVHEGDTVNLEDLMQVPRIRIHGQEDFEKFKLLVSE